MKRIAIVENPHGGWQRGLIIGLADYAAAMEHWDVRQFSPLPGVGSRVRRWNPDAIVCNMMSAEMRATFRRMRAPIVSTGLPETAPELPVVGIDHAATGRLAAEHFAGRGYRNLAFLKELNHPWWNRIEGGLLAAARAARMQVSVVDMKCATQAERRTRIARWLRDAACPVAVCADPAVALDAAIACRQERRIVPEEVAILSLEDNELNCRLCAPPLSGIRHAGEQAGQLCGRLLSRMLRGGKPKPRVTLLPPTGIAERRSTEATAIDDPLVAKAVHLMRQHAVGRTNIKELLGELSVSRRTLENRFMKALGRSPLEALHTARVERIRGALCDTDRPVKEVAAHFGYGSIQQFSREFRRLTGESASEFRGRRAGAGSASGSWR